jgi:hypothetical protein
MASVRFGPEDGGAFLRFCEQHFLLILNVILTTWTAYVPSTLFYYVADEMGDCSVSQIAFSVLASSFRRFHTGISGLN